MNTGISPRILFVSPFSSLYGGELCFYEAITGLLPAGHDLRAAVGGDGPLYHRLAEAGVEVTAFNFTYMSYRGLLALRFGLRLAPTVLSLAKFIRANGITLVYNNSLFNPYGALAARLARVPCIWHVHDLGNNKLIKASMTRLIGILSARVVVVSKAVKSIFPDNIHPRIRLVYNGVDAGHFDPQRFDRAAIRSEFGLGLEQPVALFAGRLHETKRPLDTLEAVRLLVDRMPDLVLLIAGTGDLEALISERIRDSALEQHVRMLGYRADVDRLLAAADVLVLSSSQEAFGRVLIESMAMKTPVVGSCVGGIAEVVDESCGILVPPGQPGQIAAAMERILSDSALAQAMGEAARQRVLDHFTLAHYVHGVEEVICETVREHSP